MQIAAFDADELADGSGKAAIKWIAKQALQSDHRMNPERQYDYDSGKHVLGTGSIGGWEHSEMRAWLKNEIKPLIPAMVRNAIKPVTKYSSSYDTSIMWIQNQTSTEDIWIPSVYEVFGSIYSFMESSGPSYTALFTNNDARVRKKSGASSASWWWLRSASANDNFNSVNSDGSNGSYDAHNSGAVVLGFCM